MKQIVLIVVCLFFLFGSLKSAEPIVLPPDKIEGQVAGPNLWIEYAKTYYAFLALKNQYESYGFRYNGKIPNLPTAISSYAQLRRAEYDELYNITNYLVNEIKKIDDFSLHQVYRITLDSLRNQNKRLQLREIQLSSELFECERYLNQLPYYQQRAEDAISSYHIERLKIEEERSKLYKLCFESKSYTILSVGAFANKLYYRDERLGTSIGIGGMAVLHPGIF